MPVRAHRVEGPAVDNVQLMRDLYDAFGRSDFATILAGMDPDIEWHEAEGNPYRSSGEAWRGPDAILVNLFVKFGVDWDGFAVHPNDFHDSGDTIVVEGRYTGRHKQTGRELDAQTCHVWRIRDGKVVGFQQYMDTAHLQDVMGVA
jgi:ketosteroid isomerase-like protein